MITLLFLVIRTQNFGTILALYNLKNLIREPTCFKSVDNLSCIDLVLTNSTLVFTKLTYSTSKNWLLHFLRHNKIHPVDLAQFTNISKYYVWKNTHLKESYGRYNEIKFMNKSLQAAIMNRSRLLNSYRNERQKQITLHLKDR